MGFCTRYEDDERRQAQRRHATSDDAEQLATLDRYLALTAGEREARRVAYREFERRRADRRRAR